MNRLNKWDFVDIQMAETSKLELAQEYADREMENLKAFAEESDPTLTKAKKGMTEQWAEAYTRWMLALRIMEIIARHEKWRRRTACAGCMQAKRILIPCKKWDKTE